MKLDFIGKKDRETNKLQLKKAYGSSDYNAYIMSVREKLIYITAAAAVSYAIGFVFYHSHLLSLMLCPFALGYPKIRTLEIIEKRKSKLNFQFKDMIYSLSSSLTAGKSVESAFRDVLKDLAILYPDRETDIIIEVETILRKIEMNETVESALADFAARSHLEDIENFADVFYTCKRTGGNIIEIIRNTSSIISDKIEIRNDIDTLLAARKFEQKVLNVMPVLMVVLLSFSAADYIAPIFNTWTGRVAMTISISLLVAAFFISRKIMDIKI
ncbi:MAG: pilus assembly protein TadB [Clostridia bacterium]|nr:pilus assembly protein TadB [Clostridia bacterium]